MNGIPKVSTCTHRGKLSLRVWLNGRPRYRTIKDPGNVAKESQVWIVELLTGAPVVTEAPVEGKTARPTKQPEPRPSTPDKPLLGPDSYMSDFLADRKIRSSRSKQRHAVEQRITRVFQAAKLASLDDLIDDNSRQPLAKRLKNVIYSLRKQVQKKGGREQDQPFLSAESRNHYIQSCKSFTLWLTGEHYLAADPLRKLDKPPVAEQKFPRGYFTQDEVERFIDFVRNSVPRNNLTGPERAMLYQIGMYVGLRRYECSSLTPASFDLDSATVIVKGEHTKNGKPAILPILPSLVKSLRVFLQPLGRNDRLFPNLITETSEKDTALLIKKDLADAGIPLFDQNGHKRVFHSLKASFTTLLSDRTNDIEVIRQLSRHKDYRTTLRYIKKPSDSLRAAVNLLAPPSGT